MDVAGVRQAVKKFWCNDSYYPRPDSHSSLCSASGAVYSYQCEVYGPV